MHDEYIKLDEEAIRAYLNDDKGIVIDVKGFLRNKIKHLTYWSL